jgi:hypothetical protein
VLGGHPRGDVFGRGEVKGEGEMIVYRAHRKVILGWAEVTVDARGGVGGWGRRR